jgi:hypothetical protein
MPSRFVEVSTPIEDSVDTLSHLWTSFVYTVSNIVPANATERASAILSNAVPEVRGIEAITGVVKSAPKPTGTAYVLLVSAVALFVLRWMFIVCKSRRILAVYGHTKEFSKDL